MLCFPFIFRGALDVGATVINDEMQIACVEGDRGAGAGLVVGGGGRGLRRASGCRFGRDYLIPKAFDPRLLAIVAGAVAKAAMATGVATRPVADIDAYRDQLNRSVYRSAFIMRRVFEVAHSGGRRIVFAEGEDERVLHAVRRGRGGPGAPILIGRPEVIAARIEKFGLRTRAWPRVSNSSTSTATPVTRRRGSSTTS